MNSYEVKHELGKHLPVSFRNAVLDRFTVEDDLDRVIIRLSYYHIKAKNTIHYQIMVMYRELEYLGADFLKDVARQLLRGIKRGWLEKL